MVAKKYYVYIMCNRKGGSFYIGFTNDIRKRAVEHKSGAYDGYTEKYRIDKLVYFEEFFDKKKAVLREQQLKKWNRAWKVELIEKQNPKWIDLFGSLPRKLTGVEILDSLFRLPAVCQRHSGRRE